MRCNRLTCHSLLPGPNDRFVLQVTTCAAKLQLSISCWNKAINDTATPLELFYCGFSAAHKQKLATRRAQEEGPGGGPRRRAQEEGPGGGPRRRAQEEGQGGLGYLSSRQEAPTAMIRRTQVPGEMWCKLSSRRLLLTH